MPVFFRTISCHRLRTYLQFKVSLAGTIFCFFSAVLWFSQTSAKKEVLRYTSIESYVGGFLKKKNYSLNFLSKSQMSNNTQFGNIWIRENKYLIRVLKIWQKKKKKGGRRVRKSPWQVMVETWQMEGHSNERGSLVSWKETLAFGIWPSRMWIPGVQTPGRSAFGKGALMFWASVS